MYPPNRSDVAYSALPIHIEDGGSRGTHISSRFNMHIKRRLLLCNTRTGRWLCGTISFILIFLLYRYFTRPLWAEGTFIFDTTERPTYLDDPVERPLVIRLAIISRADEFQTRAAMRDAMLAGISPKDVELEYKFFVGKPAGWKKIWTSRKLSHEMEEHDDISVSRISDTKRRLAERRLVALNWAGSVSHHRYDYSMTIDSDTFVRFHTLVRRLHHLYPTLKPRQDPIAIGRMHPHLMYWNSEVEDRDTDPTSEDLYFKGPWYSYPMGIGYLISSNLTETLLSAQTLLPHHMNYPWDDVMIGSWIASLKEFHNPDAEFMTTLEHPPYRIERVKPKPVLPYSMDSTMLDDQVGWHDFVNRKGGAVGKPIGWDTACIHRIRPKEMRAFRLMKEINGEWEEGSYVPEE